MGQFCGKASKTDGEGVLSYDVQQLEVEEPPVQVVGSWQVPSKGKPSPLGRPPLSPPRDPPSSKKLKKSKSKKDKEKKGFRQTLDAWSSFGSFNGSINERQGREKRVGILGFEVANLVMKMMNLRLALFEDELSRFKEEVILSEASRKLISEDERTLWTIAALDRRRELAGLMMDVARLGKQSADAELQKLDKKFASLGAEGEVRPKLSPSEVEANIEWLQEQVASTADLYHELLALDTVNASLRRTQAEEEQFPGTQKESVGVLKQEAKEQERLVRSLKKKGLWSKKLDHILEVLVELVYALYEQLIDAFYPEVMEETLRAHPAKAGHENELGVQGLSLHYANVISAIDRMVSRPNSVSPASRDALYQMLPQGIKASLRDEINKPLEDDSVAGIRRNLDVILDVVTPVAGNTVRWCSDRRLQGHSDLCLMQTLHHADRARTESLLLDLVVNLHHLMSRAKNPLNPSGKSPNRTPSRSPIMTPPRAFAASGPDADVAEALEEIPVHLRASVEPSVVERADAILAKLDALRTVHLQDNRAAGVASGRFVEVGGSEAGGMNGMGGTNGMGGMGVHDSARRQSGADGTELRDAARREESKGGARALGAVELTVTVDNREEADSSEPTAGNGVTSAKSPRMSPGGSPRGVSLWTAMADDVERRKSEDGSQTPDARETVPSDAFAADTFDSPPGWGLGLLRKSMSVKRDGVKVDGNASGGVGDPHGGTHVGTQPEGPTKLHRAGSGGIPRLGEEDVKILPKGWHPADRILEGEDGEAVFGFRNRLGSNHSGSSRHYAGLRGEGNFRLSEEEGPSTDGVKPHNGLVGPDRLRLNGNQGGLEGVEDMFARDHYGGLRGESSFGSSVKIAESSGAESPGLQSEVSLNDGIGLAEKFHSDSYIDLKVRGYKMSSDLYQPTGLGPNGTSNGQSDHGLTHSGGGLRHGFGSDLQIGAVNESDRVGNGSADSNPLSTQRFAEAAGNGGVTDQARSPDGQAPVQSYPGDFAKLTHRSSDPGALPSRPHPPSHSARSNSYSGPQDPTGARKSRFSVQGSSQGNDTRSYSENNLHGLGQPPTRKSGELWHDARKLSGELRKHSGELKSPGSSKRLSHEVLGSPRTPRRSSPNSRSLHRRTGSMSRSPGSSMSSPRSLEPLSPAGVIDIDLIDI